jgi:hypothetical protein
MPMMVIFEEICAAIADAFVVIAAAGVIGRLFRSLLIAYLRYP